MFNSMQHPNPNNGPGLSWSSYADTTTSDEHRSSRSLAHGPPPEHNNRLLPIANVGRIMKQILPPNAKVSKEAKETMQECVSEFISFVTCEASDRCCQEKRKTVNGDDVCWALENLGFDDYAEVMSRYLSKYREAEDERVKEECGPSDGGGGELPTVRMIPGDSNPAPFNFSQMSKLAYFRLSSNPQMASAKILHWKIWCVSGAQFSYLKSGLHNL